MRAAAKARWMTVPVRDEHDDGQGPDLNHEDEPYCQAWSPVDADGRAGDLGCRVVSRKDDATGRCCLTVNLPDFHGRAGDLRCRGALRVAVCYAPPIQRPALNIGL
jgi:hypothetical protein